MRPKSGISQQGDLFRSRLDQILNRQPPLFKRADSIDWSVFEKEFGTKYIAEEHLERVNFDTTVQEKAIAFPTDARWRRYIGES